MSGKQPFRIFLIDTVSAWIAFGVFLCINLALQALTRGLLPGLDELYSIGMTSRATLLALVIGPLIFVLLRFFGKTSIWDLAFWLIILAALIMLSRYGTCSLRLVDDHLYAPLFDSQISYQVQCSFFALLNFVVAVPKILISIFGLGLCRDLMARVLRVDANPD